MTCASSQPAPVPDDASGSHPGMRRGRHWLWWLLLVLPILAGLGRLRLDVEILNLLPPNEPVVEGLKLYQQNFSNARELIVTVQSAPALAESAAQSLATALRRATHLTATVTWQPPWRENPAQSA